MVTKPPVDISLYSRSENDVSVSSVPDVDVSGIRNGIVTLNISNFSELESERNQRHWQQEQILKQQRNPFVFHADQPQNVQLPQTCIGMNQFLQNPTNFSSEVQPILQSSGFTPPHYATDPRYMMTSGTHVYPNMTPAGYFPPQYTIGGYAFNPPPVSPYLTGYLPNSPFQTPFSSQSQPSGVNLQLFNNFYGHLRLPFNVEEQKLQSLGSLGHANLNSRRVGPTSPYYFGRPTNMDFLQCPTSPFARPLIPGSPIGGAGHPGRRNEGAVFGGWKGHNGSHAINDPKTYSFLEDLKSGKGHGLELSDIFGHIVEFRQVLLIIPSNFRTFGTGN